MSTSSTMGLMPRLLPITGSFLGPFAVLNAVLSLSVVAVRLNTNTGLGDRSRPLDKANASDTPSTIDPLLLATRLHGNFLESVPLAIVAAAVVELNGGSRKALTYALSTLFVARIAHIFGMSQGSQPARGGGYFTTIGVITGLGGWAAYLTKSYWGF